jgi:hypothetical protein
MPQGDRLLTVSGHNNNRESVMRYYVYRTGSNAANQPMNFEPVLVATVEAESGDEAKLAAAERVTVYNNQFLSAEEADVVDARETEIDGKVEVAE